MVIVGHAYFNSSIMFEHVKIYFVFHYSIVFIQFIAFKVFAVHFKTFGAGTFIIGIEEFRFQLIFAGNFCIWINAAVY